MDRSQSKKPTDLRDHFRRDAPPYIQPQAGPSRPRPAPPSRGINNARGRDTGAGSSKENPIDVTFDDDDVGSGFGSATNVTSGNSSMTDVRSGREVDWGRKGVGSRSRSVSASGMTIGRAGHVAKTQRVELASGDASASARTRKLGDEIRRLASVEPSSTTQPWSTAQRESSRESRRDNLSQSVPASAPRRQATLGPAPLPSSSRSFAAAPAPFASSSRANSTIPRASASISPQKVLPYRPPIAPSSHRVDPRRLSRGERADDPIEIESTDSERVMRTSIDVTESPARTSMMRQKRGLPSPGEPLRSPSKPRGIFGSHGKDPQDRHLPTLQLRRTSTISSEEGHSVPLPPPPKKGRQAVPGGPEAIRAARSLSQQRDSSSSLTTITSSQDGPRSGSGRIGGRAHPSSDISSIGAVSLIASHEPNSDAGPSRTPTRRFAAPFPLGPPPAGSHNTTRQDTTPRAHRNLHHSTPTRTVHPSTSPTTPRIPITPSKPIVTPTKHSTPRQTYLSPRAPTHLLISPPKRKRSAEDLDADFHPVHPSKRAERSAPSRRPTRTRPAPGTYAVPQMDAPDDEWRAKTQVVRRSSRPDHGATAEEVTPLTPGVPTSRTDRTGIGGEAASVSGQALSSSASHIGTPKRAARRMTSPLSPLSSQESPGRVLSQRASQLEPVQEEVAELGDELDHPPILQPVTDQVDEQREERESTEVEEEEQDGADQPEEYDVLAEFADFEFTATPTKPASEAARSPHQPFRIMTPSALISPSRHTNPRTPSQTNSKNHLTPSRSKLGLSPSHSLTALRPASPLAGKSGTSVVTLSLPATQVTPPSPDGPSAQAQSVDVSVSEQDAEVQVSAAEPAGSGTQDKTDDDADSFIASLLAKDEALRKAQQEEVARISEARRKKWDLVEEDDEDEEEETVEMVDLDALTRDKPVVQSSEPTRRSSRLASASLESETRRSLPSTQAIPRAAPAPFNRILREHSRAVRKGTTAEDALRMLASIDERERASASASASPTKRTKDVPYPTPDSVPSPNLTESIVEEEEEVVEDHNGNDKPIIDDIHDRLDIAALAAKLPDDFDGLGAFDSTIIRDAKRGLAERDRSSRTSVMPDWEGFWDLQQGSAIKTEVKAETREAPTFQIQDLRLRRLVDMAANGQVVPLVTFITFGAMSTVLGNQCPDGLPDFLLDLILRAESPEIIAQCSEALVYLIDKAPEHPFGNPTRLLDTILDTWRALGARTSLLKRASPSGAERAVRIERQSACSVICAITLAAAKKGYLHTEEVKELAPLLVLLAADSTTIPALRRDIDVTLPSLWPIWLAEADAVRVAQDLVEGAKPYTSEVQASLLLAVGIRTHQAKVISRWMGIGLLVPGCLNDLGTSDAQAVPSLDLLLKGVDNIYHLLSSRNESHEHIAAKAKDWITFLYEAVDVAGLVESLPVPKEGEDHALRVLTSAVNRAAHKIVLGVHADSRQIRNKSRLDQLRTIIQIQTSTELSRKKAKARLEKLGGVKGMKEGVGAQMKLAFGTG